MENTKTIIDNLCLPYEVHESTDKDGIKTFVATGKFTEKSSFVCEAPTLDELKDKVHDAFKNKVDRNTELLFKRAIWLSSYQNNKFTFFFSFTIVGIGLFFNKDKTTNKIRIKPINHWKS